MKLWTRLLALLIMAALVPALGAACGGGGKKKDADGGKATATRSADSGDETPDDDASPTKRASSKTSTPTKKTTTSARKTTAPLKTKAATAVAGVDLDSFHYQVEIGFSVVGETESIGGTIEGDYVAPDSHSYSQQFSFAGISGSEDAVIIGGEAWHREGESDWEEADPDTLNTDLTSADPEFIAGDTEFIEDIDVLDSEDSDVDGRAARKYSFSLDDIEALSGLLGDDFLDASDLQDIEDFSMVIWIDEDNDVILRADLTATAKAAALGDTGLGVDADQSVKVTLTLLLTNVNDDSIEIEPPI
ncbi:MAG: hypothetical protein HY873_04060 [Chloroflexi bacterium]|nr:hypothetical protein [Chloroflexota bacterium]